MGTIKKQSPIQSSIIQSYNIQSSIMIGGDMYRGYLLIILLLLCHTTFSSATPRWSVFHHNDGTIDLLFDNIPALSGGCPAIKLPSSSNQITTYCSPGTMTST